MSRAASTAVALVHHVRKNAAQLPGQALRGSGDFWAWGDSNLYLARSRNDALLLTVEHRSAPAPSPIPLQLQAPEHSADPSAGGAHLQVLSGGGPPAPPPLAERILAHLRHDRPTSHRSLRAALRVRDQTLSNALRTLHAAGRLSHTPHGWRLSTPA